MEGGGDFPCPLCSGALRSWGTSLLCLLQMGSSLLELPLSLSLCQGLSLEGGADPDGGLDLEEFTQYLREREQRLLLLFHSLDRNQDGKVQGWGCGDPGDASGVRTDDARRSEAASP